MNLNSECSLTLWISRCLVVSALVLALVLLAGMYLTLGCSHTSSSDSAKGQLPPGPKPWFIVGNLFQVGHLPHRSLMPLQRKYGPLMYLRLGNVPTIVTNHPAILRELCKTQDHVFASRPRTAASEILDYDGRGIALAPLGAHWRYTRKLTMLEILSPKKILSLQGVRYAEADNMVRMVMETCQAGKEIHLKEVLATFTVNMITRILIGESKDPVEACEYKELVVKAFHLIGVLNIGDFLPWLRRFDLQGFEKQMKEVHQRQDELFNKYIGEHHRCRLSGAPKNDLLDTLLTVPGPGGLPKLDELTVKAIIVDMFAASTDTTAGTIEWAMAEFLRQPKVMSKVQSELDLVVGTNRRVEEADLSELLYLRACVKETFRLHPPLPFLIPRVSTEDTVVSGYLIPQGTRVLINTFDMGRNPDTFKYPDELIPERWRPSEDEGDVKLVLKTVHDHKLLDMQDEELGIIPFGAGRRGCPGAALGENNVLLGLGRLLHMFDWTLPHDVPTPLHLDMNEGLGFSMPRAKPLIARAIPRLGSHLYEVSPPQT